MAVDDQQGVLTQGDGAVVTHPDGGRRLRTRGHSTIFVDLLPHASGLPAIFSLGLRLDLVVVMLDLTVGPRVRRRAARDRDQSGQTEGRKPTKARESCKVVMNQSRRRARRKARWSLRISSSIARG